MKSIIFAGCHVFVGHIVYISPGADSLPNGNPEISMRLSTGGLLKEYFYDTSKKGGYPASVNCDLRLGDLLRKIYESRENTVNVSPH